jgi:hypothetical protein
VISKPFDGFPHQAGNGQTVAFAAKDRATVRTACRTALRLGGRSEGEPGYALSTTPTTMALTSETRKATRSVSCRMAPSEHLFLRPALPCVA